MDLIDREKALACFDGWYNPIRDEWHDVEEIPGYEKLEELPIVAEVEDCISRQDAIDALDGTKVDADEEYCHEYAMGYNDGIDFAVSKLSVLPSAQPEPITLNIGHALTEEEIKNLKQKIADSPIVLMPYEKPKVIHCKDCKYVGTDATCCLVCNREGMGLRPYHVYHDDYCSYAERRQDGH